MCLHGLANNQAQHMARQRVFWYYIFGGWPEGPAPKNIIPKNPRRLEIFGGFRGKWPKHFSGRKTAACSFGKMLKMPLICSWGKTWSNRLCAEMLFLEHPKPPKKAPNVKTTENPKPENPPKMLWICLLGKTLANRVCAKMLFLEHPKMPKHGPDTKKLKIQKLKNPQNAMNLLVEKISANQVCSKIRCF